MTRRHLTAGTLCLSLAFAGCAESTPVRPVLSTGTDAVLDSTSTPESWGAPPTDADPANEDTGPTAVDANPTPLPPCLANGLGAVVLQDPALGDTIIDYAETVAVEATHLEPGGCLTGMTLSWSRQEGCDLTLTFSPSVEGFWQLEEATLDPGEVCGQGGVGVGTATLSDVPDITASSPPPYRCTVLGGPIQAHGVVLLNGAADAASGLSLKLSGLGVDGMLPSTAVEVGSCGTSYLPCVDQDCGQDPWLGTSCGACGESAICESGVCQEVDPVIAVCSRVLQDRADLSEGAWTGSVASCEPGEMALDWRERALKSTNLYRWLAGQPPLALNTGDNSKMQECAVMMHAAGSLSHNPGDTWPCYTEGGATVAGGSNLAPVPAVEAVDLYMADPGNATTIGHRRWILSDWLDTTAFGSTSERSCMWVSGGFGGTTPWVAWPPPGFYPMELHEVAYQTIDETGWTLQSDVKSLDGAQAQVTQNGQDMPVEVVELAANYGSFDALKITPQGWTMQTGAAYEVVVTTPSEVIAYNFQAVDCHGLLNP